MTGSDEELIAREVVQSLRHLFPEARIVSKRISAPGEIWAVTIQPYRTDPEVVDILIEYFDHVSRRGASFEEEGSEIDPGSRVSWIISQVNAAIAEMQE